MTTSVGIGLVGCGRIAQLFHLPVLRELAGARLLAVADADHGARAAAQRVVPGVRAVASTSELLAAPGVDAVVIALPTHLHADAAVAALEAGKHVYLEKPIGVDLAEAARVRGAWRSSGLIGNVGFNLRFHPLLRQARDRIRRGELGSVVAVRGVFSSAPRELPEWKRSRATGGGALLDLTSHQIDLVRHLLGAEVTAVSASVGSVRTDDDTASVALRLSNGAVAQLLASASAAPSDRWEVLGTAATLEIDRMARRRATMRPAVGASGLGEARRVVVEGVRSTADRLRPPAELSFRAALAAFVRGVTEGRHFGATVDDGFASLAVVAAAERAAMSKRQQTVGGAAVQP